MLSKDYNSLFIVSCCLKKELIVLFSHYAFIAQAGHDYIAFDEERMSKHVVITALIIRTDILEEVKAELDHIHSTYIQNNSKSLEQLSPNNRKEVIEKLLSFHIDLYAIIVDKDKLWEVGGFGYQQLLDDYMNRRLYNDLFESNMSVQIFAESEQKHDFLKKFESYIGERHTRTLFNPTLLVFEKKSDNTCLQFADIINELIFNAYENPCDENRNLIKKLTRKFIRLEEWPYKDDKRIMNRLGQFTNTYDHIIAEKSIQFAQQYIDRHEYSEEGLIQNRVNFLKYLLAYLSIGRDEYIYGQEVIKNMQTFSKEPINRDTMSDIVGPLRDEGILIASTSNGYKIPTATKDLIAHADFSCSRIVPMFRRLDNYRQIILNMTDQQLDILAGEQFKEIKQFLDSKY